MERKSVYVLTALMPVETIQGENPGDYEYDNDGSVMIRKERIGCFDSVKEAENAIKKLISIRKEENEKWGEWITYFGFFLDEVYLNDPFFGEGNISYFESRRSYLSTGELNCFSDLDYRCEKKFSGRDEPIVWVRPEDYAYVVRGDWIVPVLIQDVSYTKEQWKNFFKPGVTGDFTDDSGIAIIKGYGHEHPFSPDVFPLWCLEYGKLSEETKTALKEERKQYLSGDSL